MAAEDMDEDMDGVNAAIVGLREDNHRLRNMCLIGEQMMDVLISMTDNCKCRPKNQINKYNALRVKYEELKDRETAMEEHRVVAHHVVVDNDDEDSRVVIDGHSMSPLDTQCGRYSDHNLIDDNCGKRVANKVVLKKSLLSENITHFESIVDSIDMSEENGNSLSDNHNNFLITIEGIDDSFYRADPTQDVKLEFILPSIGDQFETIESQTSTTGAVDIITDTTNERPKPDARVKTTNKKRSNNKSRVNNRSKTLRSKSDKTNTNSNTGSNNSNNKNCNRVKCLWPGCSLEFRDKYNLSVHMVRHTGEKSFHCRSAGCQKTYATKAALDVHYNTHSDNRRFKCTFSECDAAFIRKTQLTVHVSDKHTGLKPFRCNWPGCEYQACYLNRLQSHKLRHTGEKPYKCSQCEWSFRLSHHLKTHMLKHTGERPHACQHHACDKRFQSKQAMRTHYKRTHSKQ